MTAKEYLRKAFYLDIKINCKIDQIKRLKDLVLNLGGNVTGIPRSHEPKGFDVTINKIVDLQNEINQEIDKLVDLKRDITTVIEEVTNEEYRLILELRYLNYKNWEQIALEMGYTSRNIHYMHGEALKEIRIP